MCDTSWYKGILNITVSQEELENICAQLDEKEYDIDNSFEKYYDLNLILKAIEKCENKEISGVYLANWCNVYNWIITAKMSVNLEIECKSTQEGFKECVQNEISQLLDSLSFFDDDKESKKYYNLKKFKNWFKLYDELYQKVNELEIFEYSVTDWDGEDCCVFVVIDHKTKTFSKITYIEDEDVCCKYKENKPIFMQIDAQIEDLKNKGYKQKKI